MALPPKLLGGANETVALPLPGATEPIDGASGTVAVTEIVLLPEVPPEVVTVTLIVPAKLNIVAGNVT